VPLTSTPGGGVCSGAAGRDRFRWPKPNKRVTRGNKETRWAQSLGATVLERRIEQGQLWVFTPFGLRNSHRLGVPLGGEGIGWELQVQAPFHI
jgi:hypothetical protein